MELSVVMSAAKRLVSPPKKGGSFLNSLASNLDSYHAYLQEPGQNNLKGAVQTALEDLDIPEWKTEREADEQSQVLKLYCQYTAQGLALLCLLDDALRRAEADDREAAEKAKGQARVPSKHPPAPKTLLTPAEEKSINTVLQFVVSLGLFPFLLPGADLILTLKLGHSVSLRKAECPLATRARYLYHCCRVLTGLFTTPVVGSSVLSRHLCDTLAALLQICYGPCDVAMTTQHLQRRKRNEDKCSSSAGEGTTGMRGAEEEECGLGEPAAPSFPALSSAQREWCLEELGSLLNRVHQPLVVRELLSLQGMPSKSSGRASSREGGGGERGGGGGRGLSATKQAKQPVLATPRWLQRACGRLLSERLMQKNGVHSVLLGIYDVMAGGGGAGCHGDWRRAQAVAHIIASCPAQAGSVESYYSTVCPQVLELVRVPMEGGSMRVAAATVSAMMRQQPSLARTHLFLPLTSPLRQLTTEMEVHYEQLAALGKDIEASIANLYKLCGAVEPSSPLLAALLPYLPVLFDLWRAYSDVGRKMQGTISAHVRGVLLAVLSPLDSATVVSFLRHLAGFPTTQSTDQLIEWAALASGIAAQWTQGRGLHLRAVAEGEGDGEEGKGVGDGEETAVGGRWSVERMESIGQAILKLLEVELKTSNLVGRFFTECLTHVTTIICQDAGFQPSSPSVRQEMEALLATPEAERSDGASSALLIVEQNMTTPTQREAFYRSLALYLTATLSENMSDDILEQIDLPHLLEVLSVIVECHAHLTTSSTSSSSPLQLLVTQPDLDQVLGGPISLSIALGYLTAVLGGGKKVDRELRPHLSSLLQPLETLSTSYPDPELSALARDLRVCIATLGAVWSEEMKETATKGGKGVADKVLSALKQDSDRVGSKDKGDMRSEVDGGDVSDGDSSFAQFGKEGRTKCKLVEEVSGGMFGSSPLTQPKASAVNGDREGEPSSRSAFQQCLEELQDPQVPIRGHALASLARLIRDKNDEALASSAQLLEVFKENLHHSDSYVYLAAINGLVAMATVQPSGVLEVLCEEYAMFGGSRQEEVDKETGQLKPNSATQAVPSRERARRKGREETLEFRLKLGEALVRVARVLGETLPHYSDMLLGAVLTSVQDPDPLVRASSLSNLAEICQLLGHSFGSVHHEVLSCVSSVLLTDSEPRVQQAALLVLTLLLKGLSGHAVQVLGDSLRDVYRLLKQVERSERDELTRTHAQAALGELDRVMREWIFPQQTLEKKISIL